MQSNGPLPTSPSAIMSVPTDHFFGILSAPNHTSETWLEGWAVVICEFFELYNSTQHGGHMLVSSSHMFWLGNSYQMEYRLVEYERPTYFQLSIAYAEGYVLGVVF